MDCSLPGSSVHRISQARILDGLPFPSLGDIPEPGIEPASPALAGGFFTTDLPGKLIYIYLYMCVCMCVCVCVCVCVYTFKSPFYW